MGDEEGEVKKYAYAGERAAGKVMSITAGEEPKVLTKDVELLGERHGVGEAIFPTGDVYKGDFAGGVRSGTGAYTYAAQPPPEEGEEPKPALATYDGKWKSGAKSGVGELTFTGGGKYHGHFDDGKFSGQGTFFFPNGDIYTGEWAKGKKNGAGTYIYKATGSKLAGDWKDDVCIEGTFTDKWGNAYRGRFAGDATAPGSYVAGGKFELVSGASATIRKPTKAELLEEIAAYDADGNGFIDQAELKAILTRPGTGGTAMTEDEAMVMLMILTEAFDANADGKLSVAEVVTALSNQYLM